MTAEVIEVAALEMAVGRAAAGVTPDGVAPTREPAAWTAPLGSGMTLAGEAAEADRPTGDEAEAEVEVAGEPAA
ncbi:MAG TPA: hypothetical protein VGI00_06125 [Streptosporangiaceae bacterium]